MVGRAKPWRFLVAVLLLVMLFSLPPPFEKQVPALGVPFIVSMHVAISVPVSYHGRAVFHGIMVLS